MSFTYFVFWSCRTIFSFHITLLLVRTYYFLRCTVLWHISLFCESQSYFLPCSDFVKIFLLLRMLSFCFSSECLPSSHQQVDIALDNSKYLLFSYPSHTCPHSTFVLISSAFPLLFPAGRPPLLIVIKTLKRFFPYEL